MIATHNIPEGLAIALVLVPRGTSIPKASAWSIFTSLPKPLMVAPAFLFVAAFEPLLPIGFGLAAGAMIWMVFAGVIPGAIGKVPAAVIATSTTLAFAAMLGFQFMMRMH